MRRGTTSVRPSAVAAALAVGVFLVAYWAFGWGYPTRSDLEAFLVYGFRRDSTLDGFRGDGTAVKIDRQAFGVPADISCHRISYRRLPTLHYSCFYTSAGGEGDRYRLVIVAEHNRGWKRHGLADVGDYRLTFPDADRQRAIFAEYRIDLKPSGEK